MKYVVILGDGMADLPIPKLGGLTPLEKAKKPHMDALAKIGTMGMARTVYDGFSPGSDIANLCVMGYDPRIGYSGRSPLEAASIGVSLSDTDITYRANTVTLSDEDDFNNKKMLDYSGGEISTEEADELIKAVNKELASEIFSFYTGTAYRHLLLRKDCKSAGILIPPHDISGKVIGEYLPQDKTLLSLMQNSYTILNNNPINRKRILNGKAPANCLWFWGEGTKPKLKSYRELFGLSGAVISAVDLIKGIGILAGLRIIEVPGATGNLHTNLDGKREAAIEALKDGLEFVYIHIEAADESGHQGNLYDKIRSIEMIDEKIVGPVYSYLKDSKEPFNLIIMPDHPTPVELMTHTIDPVPFLIVKNNDKELRNAKTVYSEKAALAENNYIEFGHTLMHELIKSSRE